MVTKTMKATIELLIEVEDDENADANAADAVSEALRPLCREFDSNSSIIDWRYSGGVEGYAEDCNGNGFELYEESGE